MKIKGINPFERNIEKIVLGTVAAVFLGVLALQFVRQPNSITVDGKTVPPADAYRDLEQKAGQLSAGMDQAEPPAPPTTQGVDLIARFRAGTEGDVAPSALLPWNPPGIDPGIQGGGQANPLGARIAEVRPPAPTGPIANVTAAAIHPGDVSEMPELAKVLPTQQPYDKQAVTVEASFDGTALRAALMATPAGDTGAAAMPTGWWQDTTQILGVRLEREEQTSTGEWTGTTLVAAMPGREDLASDAMGPEVVRKPELDAIIAEAAAAPARARRPEYYRTIAGPAWISPREAADAANTGGNNAQKIDRLRTSRADKAKDLAEREEQLKTAGDPPKPGPKQDDGGGRGGKVGGGGQAPTPPTDKTPKAKTKQQLEREIKNLKNDIARIDQDLKDLGAPVAEGAAPAPGAAPARTRPLLDDPSVRVWAHDLTAEPGKTYRYRVRVLINNPAFDRGAFISADQAEFAKRALLESEPSEWTGAVTVDPTQCFFVIGASEGGEGPLGGTRATAELYRFYYGYWRQGKVNLEPGDMLASSAKLPTLFSYDMAKLGATPDPGEAPAPDGGGRQVAPPRGDEPPSGQGEPVAGPGQTPLDKELEITINAVLLDVARVPGGWAHDAARLSGGGTPNQALFRDASGQISSRIPENDRASSLYDRVTKSARDGTTQGAPPPPKAEPGQGDQPPKRPGEEPPKPPPGKGGGGGGGGGGG